VDEISKNKLVKNELNGVDNLSGLMLVFARDDVKYLNSVYKDLLVVGLTDYHG